MHLFTPNSCPRFVSLYRLGRKISLLLFGMSAAALHAATQPTTTTLAVSSSSVAAGKPVTFTVTVNSNGSAVSPGQVAICDAAAPHCEDVHILGTAQLTSNGTATVKLLLPPGKQKVYAAFTGTRSFAKSSSSSQPTPVDVGGPLHSTADISRSGAAGDYTLTSAVGGEGRAPVTGTVSFLDALDNHPVASAPLTTPAATLTQPKIYLPNAIPGASAGTYLQSAAGDFNGDGIPDVAVIGSGSVNSSGVFQASPGIAVLLGDPANPGQFLSPTFTPVTAPYIGTLVSADFNADGLPDLAFITYLSGPGTGEVTILLNDPAHPGQFQQPSTLTLGQFNPQSLAAGDFNADGVMDLVTVNNNSTATILIGGAPYTGQFLSPVTFSIGTFTSNATWVAVNDFNNDGLPDFVASFLSGPLAIEFNDPSNPGNFLPPVNVSTGGGDLNSALKVGSGDYNNDGLADIVVANSSGSIGVILNSSSNPGTFLPATQWAQSPTGDAINAAAGGDYNGDGVLDFAVAYNTSPINKIGLVLGDPNNPGSFASPIFVSNGDTVQDSTAFLIAKDLNGDGLSDVIESNKFINTDTASTATSTGDLGILFGQVTQIATASHVNPGSTKIVYASYPGDSNYYGYQSCEISLDGSSPAAPVITGISVSNLTENSATISWTTNIPSYGGVYYGTTLTMDNSTPWTTPVSTTHSFTLTGLTDGTAYHYKVWSSGYFSGCSHWTNFASDTAAFVTRSAAPPPPVTTTALSVSANTVEQGTPVILTATVTSNGTPVTAGEVLFCKKTGPNCQDTDLLGMAHLSSTGNAMTGLLLPLGSTNIYAFFEGTTSYARSSSLPNLSTVQVNPAHTYSTADISKSGSTGDYTLTSVVEGIGKLPPSGTVTFHNATNNKPVATAPLDSSTLTYGVTAPVDLKIANTLTTNYLARGDFNGDGIVDIAAVRDGGKIEILWGDTKHIGSFNGSAQFYPDPSQTAPAPTINCIIAADFNADGILDIGLCLNYSTSAVLGVLMGDPGHPGQFQPIQKTSEAHGLTNLAVADFNKDGLPDLVFVPTDTDGFYIQLTDASHPGQFSDPAWYATGAYGDPGGGGTKALALQVADFNADGVPDVALFLINQSIDVVLSNPARPGEVLPFTNYPIDGTDVATMANVAVGDYNGDGLPDLVVTSQNAGVSSLAALLSNFSNPGTFLKPTTLYTYPQNSAAFSIWPGDYNGDGVLDIAVPEYTTGNTTTHDLAIFFGDASQPGKLTRKIVSNDYFTVLFAGDLNGDGLTDLVTSTPSPLNTIPNKVIATQFASAKVTATAANVAPPSGTQYVYASYSGDDRYFGYQSCSISLTAYGPSAPVISGVTATAITATSATINWTTNVPTYGNVAYAISGSQNTLTPTSGQASTTHSFTLTGLTPGTQYNFQASAVAYFNGCSHWTTISPVSNFTTAAK